MEFSIPPYCTICDFFYKFGIDKFPKPGTQLLKLKSSKKAKTASVLPIKLKKELSTGNRNIKLEFYIEEFDRYQKDPLSQVGELFKTHPYIPNRVKYLQQFFTFLFLKY